MDARRFSECKYYLNMYGDQLSYIRFHIRHGFLDEACQYLQKNVRYPEKLFPLDLTHCLNRFSIYLKHCSNETFMEDILKPCIINGDLTALLQIIRTIDPELSSWEQYLNFSCSALKKMSLFNVLNEIRLFMKVICHNSNNDNFIASKNLKLQFLTINLY